MPQILRLIFYLFPFDTSCTERLIIFLPTGLAARTGKEDAEKTLIATIQKGTADGGGQHWDMKAKMPDASERPLVSDAEAQKIYQWIMRR